MCRAFRMYVLFKGFQGLGLSRVQGVQGLACFGSLGFRFVGGV